MTVRNPLVLVGGSITELASTDSANTGASGYPVIYPSLSLDFANGHFLDDRFVFSRNSLNSSYFTVNDDVALAAPHTPRFNYLQRVCTGLLIRPSYAVVNTFSNALSDASWTKTRATITLNATTAPDGTLTMSKIVEDATAANSHLVLKATTVTSGLTYIYRVFLKVAERTSAELFFFTGAGAAFAVVVDLLTGAKSAPLSGTNGVSITTVTQHKNGFWEISCPVTMVGTAGQFQIKLMNAGADSYNGDGTSGIYCWGYNLIQAAIAYEHVTTAAAAITTAAETAVCSGSNFNFYNQNAFSVLANFYGQATGISTIFCFSDGTANNQICLQASSGALTLAVKVGGSTLATLSLGTITTDTFYSLAASWDSADVDVVLNGVLTTNAAVTLPAITQLNLGCDQAGVNQLNSLGLCQFLGWQVGLTDAELLVMAAL